MKMKSKIKNSQEWTEYGKYVNRKKLKTSLKRLSVVRYFLEADRHYTVEELYNRIKLTYPNVSYSTVYRAMKLLASGGLANVRRFVGNKIRFEPVHKLEHHDHLICLKCGKIIEFTHKGIERFQKEVAESLNFSVHHHELQLYGLCKPCQKGE